MKKFTVGMACYNDFNGVVFTVQDLRLHHGDYIEEIIVIDNNPTSQEGLDTAAFCKTAGPLVRYIPFPELGGTAQPRNEVFKQSKTEFTMCLDSHVLLVPDALLWLSSFLEDYPEHEDSLIQGPLYMDDLVSPSTHFQDIWEAAMWGKWGTDERIRESKHDTFFDIPAQGLGLFVAKTSTWMGFNSKFRGFGGEEFYIHKKYQQAGRATICLAALGWWHRFGRPAGVPYPNVTTHRIMNYVIGHKELGIPLDRLAQHFELNPQQLQGYEVASAADNPFGGETLSSCGSCGNAPTPNGIEEAYQQVFTNPSDINEHVPTLRALAEGNEVVEFGVRTGISTTALLAGKPKRLHSIDLNDSQQARALAPLALKQGTEYLFQIANSLEANVDECDVLFIDSKHTGEHVFNELMTHGHKVRKYIAFHDTEIFGERGEDGTVGILEGMRRYVRKFPEWKVKYHAANNHGFTILSRLEEDKPKLPSTIRGIYNFSKAMVKHTVNGGRFLPLQMAEERLAECSLCPSRNEDSCSKCGCPLTIVPDNFPARPGELGKAFFPTEFCPLGKWHHRPDDGIEMSAEEINRIKEQLATAY